MGGSSSLALPSLPTKDLMCIATSLSQTNLNSIILMYADEAAVEAVQNAVISNWRQGIKSRHYMCEENERNCLKLVLNGGPFMISRNGGPFMAREKSEGVQCRLMVGSIMSSLYNLGWQLIVSSDLSIGRDPATWFFQKQTLEQNMYPIFSIGLSEFDTLQINDCPEELHGVIKQVCELEWVKGIQSEEKYKQKTYEIKLKGSPWWTHDKKESSSSRVMLKEIIQKLTGQQYDLYCNTNLAARCADTLFFKHNPCLEGEAIVLLVSLNQTDRLRLFRVPESICEQIKETVVQYWPYGVQNTEVGEAYYELKLKGNPWRCEGQEAVYSRRLVTKLMEMLASIGYFVMTGLDLTRKSNDKSVFLFRKGAPLATKFTFLFLNGRDKVCFVETPEYVVEAVQSVVLSKWPHGVQDEKGIHESVTYQAKLKGTPWSEISRGDGIYGRALLLGILFQFNRLGWRLVCSGDVDESPQRTNYVHSWWFMYDERMLSRGSSGYPSSQNAHTGYPTSDAYSEPPSYDSLFT